MSIWDLRLIHRDLRLTVTFAFMQRAQTLSYSMELHGYAATSCMRETLQKYFRLQAP